MAIHSYLSVIIVNTEHQKPPWFMRIWQKTGDWPGGSDLYNEIGADFKSFQLNMKLKFFNLKRKSINSFVFFSISCSYICW